LFLGGLRVASGGRGSISGYAWSWEGLRRFSAVVAAAAIVVWGIVFVFGVVVVEQRKSMYRNLAAAAVVLLAIEKPRIAGERKIAGLGKTAKGEQIGLDVVAVQMSTMLKGRASAGHKSQRWVNSCRSFYL